jgi:light-regulated signal transduction histidine kinase (bacteriophytochrome)
MIEGCIRYSGERGSHIVHVGWRKQDDGPVFFTSCSGTGELKDLSQAFRLSSEEESEDNSTSIGLVISKRIIGLQGGTCGWSAVRRQVILFCLRFRWKRRHDCVHVCRYLRMHGESPGDIGKNGGGEGKIKRNRSGEACCDEFERGQK